MAFSTQKEFFHVPFSNETYEFECIDSCVKLKSYPSTIDDRSWSANEDKKSQFVAGLVACNSPIKKQRDEDGRPSKQNVSITLEVVKNQTDLFR